MAGRSNQTRAESQNDEDSLHCGLWVPLAWSALKLKRKKGRSQKGPQLWPDPPESSLPYVASEGDLSDFLVLKVQGELVRLLFLRRFITNFEDCPKVNIKIWNVEFTGQGLTLPVVSKQQSSLGLLHTWESVQESQDAYSSAPCRKERERGRETSRT